MSRKSKRIIPRRATNIDTEYPKSITHSDFDERNREDLIEEEPSQLRKGWRVGANTAGAHVAVTFTPYPSEVTFNPSYLEIRKAQRQEKMVTTLDSLLK